MGATIEDETLLLDDEALLLEDEAPLLEEDEALLLEELGAYPDGAGAELLLGVYPDGAKLYDVGVYGAGVYPEGDAAGVDDEAVTGDTNEELDDDALELDATLEL